jgi:hypothetical protein
MDAARSSSSCFVAAAAASASVLDADNCAVGVNLSMAASKAMASTFSVAWFVSVRIISAVVVVLGWGEMEAGDWATGFVSGERNEIGMAGGIWLLDGATGAAVVVEKEDDDEEDEEEDEEEGVFKQKSSVTGDAIRRLELSCSELLLEPAELLESNESWPAERSTVRGPSL